LQPVEQDPAPQPHEFASFLQGTYANRDGWYGFGVRQGIELPRHVLYVSHALTLLQHPTSEAVGHADVLLHGVSVVTATSALHVEVRGDRAILPRIRSVIVGFSAQVETHSLHTGGTHGVTGTTRVSTASSCGAESQQIVFGSAVRRDKRPGRTVLGQGASHTVGQTGTVVPSNRTGGDATGGSTWIGGYTETGVGDDSGGGPAKATEVSKQIPAATTRVMAKTPLSGRAKGGTTGRGNVGTSPGETSGLRRLGGPFRRLPSRAFGIVFRAFPA
jgi:hypothetical protein